MLDSMIYIDINANMEPLTNNQNSYNGGSISNHLLFFDDNKIKMASKQGKEQKENPVGCTG